MFWTKFFIPTAKERPSEATSASHQLALRAGLFWQAAAGSFAFLPLGWRVLRKIEAVLRQEADRCGAVELHLPTLQPPSVWEDALQQGAVAHPPIRLQRRDRHSEPVVGRSCELTALQLARAHVNSYRQLPLCFYQIRPVVTDEDRPGGGLMRMREPLTAEVYVFAADGERLDERCRALRDSLQRLFARCALPVVTVETEPDTGASESQRAFAVLSDAGAEPVAVSADGAYAAGVERAERSLPEPPPDPATDAMQPLREVHTPGCPSIEDVCRFLGTQPSRLIKTLVYVLEDSGGNRPEYVIVCVRGDHDVNEWKVRRLCGKALRLCDPVEADKDGYTIGYVGPHIVNECPCRLIIDGDARAVVDGVAGANREDHHVTGFNWTREVRPDRLAEAVVADVRNVVEGDRSPRGAGPLAIRRTIHIGRLSQHGCSLPQSLGAAFLDENGISRPLAMASCRLDLSRMMAAAIELHHDEQGICWPLSIAPFEVLIAALDVRDEQVMATATSLHDELAARGVDVLLDDRDQRAGFKFNDADLIGIPIRVTVGKKALAGGEVEMKIRSTGEAARCSLDTAVNQIIRKATDLRNE